MQELAGLPADSGLLGLIIGVATILGPIAFGLALVGALGLLEVAPNP